MIEAGLYHGGRALCETRTTQEIPIVQGTGKVEENLSFSIAVCNIPRNARLCLAIYEVGRSSKTTKARSSIGSRQNREFNCFGSTDCIMFLFLKVLKTKEMDLDKKKIKMLDKVALVVRAFCKREESCSRTIRKMSWLCV